MMVNLQNLFRRNLPAKLLALVAAIIMWGYIMNEENPAVTASYTVPIAIVNAPEGYDVGLSVKDVTLTVRAPRSLMATAHDYDFKAVIDLSGNTEGEYDVRIRPIMPQGFEYLEMSDESVHVTMESLIAHGVPVEISVTGKPVQGMEVTAVKPVQEYVNVYGPRRLVESISKAEGKIKLADNTSDFTMRVALAAVSADGDTMSNLTVLPNELDVTVQLGYAKVKKVVPIKAAVVGILPEGYTLGEVKAQPTQLEVSGASNVLETLKGVDTQPISLADMTVTASREVEVVLPEGVEAENKKVIVQITVNKKQGSLQ